jgi:hypothetical protein
MSLAHEQDLLVCTRVPGYHSHPYSDLAIYATLRVQRPS